MGEWIAGHDADRLIDFKSLHPSDRWLPLWRAYLADAFPDWRSWCAEGDGQKRHVGAWLRRVHGQQTASHWPDLHAPRLLCIPGLETCPWWDGLPAAKVAEAAFPDIVAECRGLRKSGLPQVLVGAQPQGQFGYPEDWTIYFLSYYGKLDAEHCAQCPSTAALLSAVDLGACDVGIHGFSALNPGAHLPAHSSIANYRLRGHLALFGTEGCRIRVATETREWIPGRCLIFDDSFEHEVWHQGNEPRLVLLFDIWHPALETEEIGFLSALQTEIVSARGLFEKWI